MTLCYREACPDPATKLQPIRGREPLPYCDYHWRLEFDPTYLGLEGAGEPVQVLANAGNPEMPDMSDSPMYLPLVNPERAQQPHPPARDTLDAPPPDLGSDHSLSIVEWDGWILALTVHHPRLLASNITDMAGSRPGGAALLSANVGDPCQMTVILDTQAFWDKTEGSQAATLLKVVSWEPLTIGGVLSCQCGDSGAVIEGRWEAAN